ncbi:E3 ubiquitin-protein ligase At3g02290-like isoform X1 [Curcuma longa]|uniref:E3 ubiquitin-protein ligase At3g02290-like isoform X1 n=2 Tax=Curcuma longa TaxID=136217 RepID=UPI003D9F5C96
MLLPSIIASPNTHEGERYSRSIASVSLPGTVFMGALCCCPCPEDFDEYAYSSNPIYQHCICLRYFFHQLLYGYGATFQRLDGRTNPTQIQTITSSTTSVSRSASDNSLSEAHHHVPRPPPYETDARYSRSQREGLVSRREKSMSHIQENLHILRRNGSSSTFETMASIKKRNIVESDEECIHTQSESEKNQSAKACGTGFVISSEDEDVCPTCLEEYTPENPKIVANCSHHFHLSCIYEWMERSDTCPVCGKEMQFCESP